MVEQQENIQAYADMDIELNVNEKLNIGGAREINMKICRFNTLIANLERLESREKAQDKNIKGLIKYAKKLMTELEEFKQKVVMSEQIIEDLQKAGSDNMGNLMTMMKQAKEREQNTIEEIEKLEGLSVIKENQISEIDVEIDGLNDYLDKMNAEQSIKIDTYKDQITINKGDIKRNDKLIVDLQQRNELTQNAMIETQK